MSEISVVTKTRFTFAFSLPKASTDSTSSLRKDLKELFAQIQEVCPKVGDNHIGAYWDNAVDALPEHQNYSGEDVDCLIKCLNSMLTFIETAGVIRASITQISKFDTCFSIKMCLTVTTGDIDA